MIDDRNAIAFSLKPLIEKIVGRQVSWGESILEGINEAREKLKISFTYEEIEDVLNKSNELDLAGKEIILKTFSNMVIERNRS